MSRKWFLKEGSTNTNINHAAVTFDGFHCKIPIVGLDQKQKDLAFRSFRTTTPANPVAFFQTTLWT